MIINDKHYNGKVTSPNGSDVILEVENFDLPIGTRVVIDDEDYENLRCLYFGRYIRSIEWNIVTCKP